MLKALRTSRLVVGFLSQNQPRSSRLFTPFLTSPLLFRFSQQYQPKNKEEAFQMQEQQRLKMKPGEEEEENKTYSGVNKLGVAFLLCLVGSLVYLNFKAEATSKQQLDFFDQEISGFRQLKGSKVQIGGDWTLVDTEGQPFSSRMLYGNYYLVYFGYANSPEACPNALYYMSTMYRVIRNLPEGAYLKLKLVFISIDPERDTPEKLKKYLKNFSKIIIGVTGSQPNDKEVEECLKKFKIMKRKVILGEDKDKYDFNFNTNIFLMDSDNNYMDTIDPSLTEQQAAKAVVGKIVSNEHKKEKLAEQTGSDHDRRST